VAGEATATAAICATSGDDDESESFKTGEAGSGSLIVASTSPADAQPVDALPASAALGWVTLVASTTAPADGAKPTAAHETVAANKGKAANCNLPISSAVPVDIRQANAVVSWGGRGRDDRRSCRGRANRSRRGGGQ